MKCYASDYCQKDKSSCSDVCGGYRVLRALYNLSRIPERYRYTIALKPENGEDLEAFTTLDNYKNDVLSMVDEGRGLYIWGKSTGNGKTSWACKIMSYFFRKIAFNTGLENEGLYIFLPTFLEDLRDNYDNKDPEFDEILRMIKTCRLLIIDDIGAERVTDWVKVAPQIKENVLPLLTSIKDAIFTGLGNIGIDTGALQAIFDQLFNVKVDGGGIASMFSGLKDGIVQAINTILPIIPPIISAVQQIAPVVGQVISTIMSGVSQIIPYIVPVIQTITNIIVTAMPVIQQIITVVVNAIVAVMPTLSSIFTFVGNVIQQVLTMIGNHMGLFQTIVSVVVTVVSTVWQTLAPIISAVVDVILTVVDGLLTGIETVFNFLAPYISQIWGSICGFFDSASSTITTIVETIKSVFQGLFDAVSTIFGGISSAVSTAIGTVTSVISGAIDAISGFVDKVGGAISKAKEFVGSGVDKVKGALGFAYGKDRVPYDNYPAILHQGEKVLTRNQADQYERRMSTRGVQLKDVTPIDRDPDDPQDNNGGTGNPQDSDLPKSGGIGSVTIEKLADTVIIEKEADTDKVVSDMVAKFKKLLPNMT